MVCEGKVGFQQGKFLEKHIPEEGSKMRKAISQKLNEIKYLLSVLWNKKLLSLMSHKVSWESGP